MGLYAVTRCCLYAGDCGRMITFSKMC